MQDLKKSKRKISSQQTSVMVNDNDTINKEELGEESAISYTTRHDSGCSYGCGYECSCDCKCKCYEKEECVPCKPDEDHCIKNPCGPECCTPINPARFNTGNSIPYAIETNRVYDTMMFQTFTDATGPGGAPLTYDYDIVEVCGPIPRGGQVNITIETVCLNYSAIRICPGKVTLEDYDVEEICKHHSKNCETIFEYAVCGERSAVCCEQGKGKSVTFKERGLTIKVEDLVLELRGKCGCTEFTALAYPMVRCGGGQTRKVNEVEFTYNTLSAPICLPADGRPVTLRQDFQTNLTVECIGKAILRLLDCDECECCYELCIPNDIDVVMCLQEIVSILISEQIVVLGSPNAIQPRVVDTFAKVCDFKTCEPKNSSEYNKEGNCGCR